MISASDTMSEIDAECMRRFPEMVDHYSRESLFDASSIGSYIFFEDYFNEFVVTHAKSDLFFQRVAAFIEELAKSENEETRNLAQIGLLEGLVNRQAVEVAAFLGKHSKNYCQTHRIERSSTREFGFKATERFWLRQRSLSPAKPTFVPLRQLESTTESLR